MDVADADQLAELCFNIHSWMSLQSDEVTNLMANAQQEHLALHSALDTTDGFTSSSHSSPPNTPPQPPPAPLSQLSPLRPSERRPTTTAAFSSINTVLAARHRRLNLQQGSPPPPAPTALAATPPSTPQLPVCTRETTHGKALLNALTRWQHNAAWHVRGRLLASVGDAVHALLLSAVRRWSAAAHARIAEATAPWRRAAPRRATRHAMRIGWRRWCAHCIHAHGHHQAVARAQAAADGHLAFSRAWRAWRTWRCDQLQRCTLLDVTDRVRELDACKQCTVGLRRWRAWLRRRGKWRVQAERRASARGGVVMLHRPCMRLFDGRAIFVEEGSAAMADAYRRRRTLAVVLTRWWVAAVASPSYAEDA